MKSYTVICFFLSLAMILFPLVSVEKAADVFSKEFSVEEATEPTTIKEETTENNVTVKVMNASSKNITELSLKDYLVGVVAEEINAAYHEEAIKAQIVAAHTKLEYTKLHKNEDLGEADINDSASSYQGFLTEEEQREKWGENYDIYHGKIEKCVEKVLNEILIYENEPINAVFHAISNGQTENSTDVWGGTFPYLASVESAGDKLSPAYKSEVKFTTTEFKEKIEKNGAELGKKPEKWVEKITNTDTGMVKEIIIGGKSFKGTEIRKIFELRSSTFTVKHTEDGFIFTVCGYGHGVGMSQYGANYMAQQGLSYKDILAHYYKNVEFSNMEN